LARRAAIQMLYQIDLTNQSPCEVMESFWKTFTVSQKVKTFADYLVQETWKRKEEIDSVIGKIALNWNLKRMAVVDRNILRLASCEILYIDDIPSKVSINEAIELAKHFSDIESAKFVNGILDKVSKRKEESSADLSQ